MERKNEKMMKIRKGNGRDTEEGQRMKEETERRRSTERRGRRKEEMKG